MILIIKRKIRMDIEAQTALRKNEKSGMRLFEEEFMEIREIEDLIKNLKSVINCRILLSDNDAIKEVHIIANESRSAKQISRDVQSILAIVYGMEIDYKKISIAQVKDTARHDNDRRLRIKAIEQTSQQSKYHVKVTLEKDQETFSGECTGMNNATLCLRLTGEAAIRAIEQYMQEEGIMSLDDIKIITIANIQTVVVALTVYSEEQSVEFCGSAILNHDSFNCVVRAVMDAINPLIERYNED